MMKLPPSIFNDVIGPVMRGPSSSHTAASVRIGHMVRQCLTGRSIICKVDFDPNGSLASTYHGQGTDIGLAGGLLKMDLTDPRLLNSLEIARQNGIALSFNITAYPAAHPNTYRITAAGENDEEMQFIFISKGGGMIELQKIGNHSVSISGDYHETLIFLRNTDSSAIEMVQKQLEQFIPDLDHCTTSLAEGEGLINLKGGLRLSEKLIAAAGKSIDITKIVQIEPALPIHSRKKITIPFKNAEEMFKLAEEEKLEMWELAVRYESARGNILAEKVYTMAEELLQQMKVSLREGLSGTVYNDRILAAQATKIGRYPGKLIGGELLSFLIAYVTAIMETKSSMGVIVASPTAGSCGVLPGTLLSAAAEMNLDDKAAVKGLLAAGLIGVLIAGRGTFAAEERGCQAECGSASGMAAAGLVQMMGGTVREALDAASMALQNIFGMVCDPVAERVEVPCLGKNVLAGLNAVGCANMALAGYDKVIPLDETIEALDQVGKMLPPQLRCTGGAGLSVTKTAREIYRRLNR